MRGHNSVMSKRQPKRLCSPVRLTEGLVDAPKLIDAAYEAIYGLGSALADDGHQWTNEQRKFWEKAERSLRPLVSPNVVIEG